MYHIKCRNTQKTKKLSKDAETQYNAKVDNFKFTNRNENVVG